MMLDNPINNYNNGFINLFITISFLLIFLGLE